MSKPLLLSESQGVTNVVMLVVESSFIKYREAFEIVIDKSGTRLVDQF